MAPLSMKVPADGQNQDPPTAHVMVVDDEPESLRAIERILRTRYRIDDFQENYFVIDSFEQLMAETAPDFAPIYRALADLPELDPGTVLPADTLFAGASAVK